MVFLPRNFQASITNDAAVDSSETIADAIVFDASLSEDHVFRNTVSSVPLEDGSKIVDHVTVEQNRLELTALFSDTPTSNFDLSRQVFSSQGRSTKLFERVLEIRDKKQIVTVITGIYPHQNMVIEEVSVPRRSGDGRKVECRIVFVEAPRVSRSGQRQQRTTVPLDPEIDHTAIPLIVLGVITAGVGIGAIISDF